MNIFLGILILLGLVAIAGFLFRENVEVCRRSAAEDKLREANARNAELADKLSRSYSRIVCQSRGVMPEIHKEA